MEKLKLALQFLASSIDEKRTVIPVRIAGKEWEIYGTKTRTVHPLFCITYECWNTLDHLYEQLDLESRKLINEIRTILGLMIELPESYEPIWTVCEPKRCVEVDTERLWDVIERLSRILLLRLGWSQVTPAIQFDAFFKTGGIIVHPRGKSRDHTHQN